MIDPRDNTLHQIDIDNNTTNREKAIVVDIEMIEGIKEKTDLRDGSTISMRVKDRDTIIVTEMEAIEGTTRILETTIEEMIHESREMHQGLIYTSPTGKFKKAVRFNQILIIL